MLDHLRLMYDYHEWANRRVLDTAENLTPGQWRESGIASFGSIHATLVHTMSAQWMWLSRWNGASPAAPLDPAAFPDLAAVRARWAEIEADTRAFVAALDAEGENSPARIVNYANSRGQRGGDPLWQLMLHQVNHGTQHRSEVAAMLTQFGHSPGELDLVRYIRGRHAATASPSP